MQKYTYFSFSSPTPYEEDFDFFSLTPPPYFNAAARPRPLLLSRCLLYYASALKFVDDLLCRLSIWPHAVDTADATHDTPTLAR